MAEYVDAMNGTGRLGHRFDSGVVRDFFIGSEVALLRSGFRLAIILVMCGENPYPHKLDGKSENLKRTTV